MKTIRTNQAKVPIDYYVHITNMELGIINNIKILSVCASKILHKYCFYFLWGLTTVPREI